MARSQKDFTYDNATLFKDAGAVTTDAAATVSAAARVLDLGANARTDGRVICDVSAITTNGATGEGYTITAQVSNSSTFASGVIGSGSIRLGAAASLPGESAASVAGRFEFHASTEVNGVLFRYMRIYTDVSGTAPSINYTAYLVKE